MGIYGWQRYLGIEKDFLDAQYYVSLDIEDAYSEFFTREVILLGAEIEAAFKELCHRLDSKSPAGNIGQYKGTILSNYPGIVNVGVRNIKTYRVIKPFAGWNTGDLMWWNVYTDVKHGLVDQAATAKVALEMLQSYEVLVFSISATIGDFKLEYSELPEMFEPTFEKGFSIMGDNRIYWDYSSEEILRELKEQGT